MKTTSRDNRSSLDVTSRPSPFAPAPEPPRDRPTVEGIRALASFHLDVLGEELESFRLGEAGDGFPLASIPRPVRPCLSVETRR